MSTLSDLQDHLSHIHQVQSLDHALETLYQISADRAWVSPQDLALNRHYTYSDPKRNITLKAQVNVVRDKYLAEPIAKTDCSLCLPQNNQGGNRCLYQFPLSDTQAYFIQATPFPLFLRHFVLIHVIHQPMLIGQQALIDLIHFVDAAPRYLALSNSDIAFAGASILDHQHYQVIRDLHLPIQEAAALYHTHLSPLKLELLRYPIAALRLSSPSASSLIEGGTQILLWWKQQAEKNTANLLLKKEGRGYTLILILRNGNRRTPDEIQPIKREGVGVVEVAGYGVYPVPHGENAQAIWHRIEKQGLDIIEKLIAGNSPLKEEEFKSFWQRLLKEVY